MMNHIFKESVYQAKVLTCSVGNVDSSEVFNQHSILKSSLCLTNIQILVLCHIVTEGFEGEENQPINAPSYLSKDRKLLTCPVTS
jgi:hypothetical protein